VSTIGIPGAVVHHNGQKANDYAPEDSGGHRPGRSTRYHTRTLGWCDIAYNALVDKYGLVFEGRAGGMTNQSRVRTPAASIATPGACDDGRLRRRAPTPIQLRTTARLIGWRLGIDHVDRAARSFLPRGWVRSPSSRSVRRRCCRRSPPTATVGNTDCPGNAAYAAMDQLPRHRGAVQRSAGPQDLVDTMRGGRSWLDGISMGGMNSPLARRPRPRVRLRAQRGMQRSTGVGVLVTAERSRARHRCDLQGVRGRWA